MKLRKTEDGIMMVREQTDQVNLAELRDELDRLRETKAATQARIDELKAILQAAKSLKDVGDEVEVQ